MRVLITGASGLLGQELLPRVAESHQIYSVGRTDLKTFDLLPRIDLSTDWDVSLLPSRIDAVIHLAQSSRYRDFPEAATEVFDVNLRSTARLLDYARSAGAKRFVLASTGGIYRSGVGPVSEDSELLTTSELGHYFATKLASEMLAGNYRPYMDVHVLRIFFMYGPRQRSGMFLPSLIDRIDSGRSVSLSGHSGISLNPVHVRDVARFVSSLLETGGPKTINIAGPEVASIRSMADSIGRLLGKQPIFERVEGGSSLVADISMLQDYVDFEMTSLDLGLEEMVKARRLSR